MTERDETIGREEGERRELEAAGWEANGRGAKAIWKSPADGRWYAHHLAVTMLSKEGPSREEARLLAEQGFERAQVDGHEQWSRLEEGALRLYTRSKALVQARREAS